MKNTIQITSDALASDAKIEFNYEIIGAFLWAEMEVPGILDNLHFKIRPIEMALVMQRGELIESFNEKMMCFYQGEWEPLWFCFSEVLDQEQVVRHCLRNQIDRALALLEKSPMDEVYRFWDMDTLEQQVMLWMLRDEPMRPMFINNIWTIIREKHTSNFWKTNQFLIGMFVRNKPCPLNCTAKKMQPV